MATEFERHRQEEGQGLPSSVAPATTPPSSPHRALTERQLKDKCFKCGKQGHWARDCPSNISTKYSPDAHLFPVLNCLCGVACTLRVSQRDTSYGRRYYARNCDCAGKFNKWCDDIEAPIMCECGAGACTINFREGSNGNYIKFYTCRIRTGHGACGFLHFDNPPISWPIEIYIRRSRRSPTHGDRPNITSHEETFAVGKVHCASSLMSRSAIRSRQMDFEKRISVAGNSPHGCKAPQSTDLRGHDRVGRLSFPDRLGRFFRCMFPLFDSKLVSEHANAFVNGSSITIPHADSSSGPSWTSSRKRSYSAMQGNVTETSSRKRSYTAMQGDVTEMESSIRDNCNLQVPNIEKVSSNYLESVSQTASHFEELVHKMGKLETCLLDFAKDVGQLMRTMRTMRTSDETAAAQLEGSKTLKMVDLFQ